MLYEKRIAESVCIELTRDNLIFSSAHFLSKPNGGSEPLHGHNYQVTLYYESDVDSFGFVVDFSVLKKLLKAIVAQLNHKVLLAGDSTDVEIITNDQDLTVLFGSKRYVFPESDVVILPVINTTCEELARYVGQKVISELGGGNLELKVQENPGQSATWRSHVRGN